MLSGNCSLALLKQMNLAVVSAVVDECELAGCRIMSVM